MVAALIVACEVGFWVLVLAGLIARYIAGWKRTGAILLLATPVVDILLIAFTIIDLRSGTKAEFIHGLAAIYIGVTVAYGHRMIKWADARFAYRFGGGEKPAPAPKYGKERARREREGWYRHVMAWFVGVALLMLMIWIVNDPLRTEALKSIPKVWGMILGIDFLISFSYTIWPKEQK